ncbi:MAG: DUF262 domain-containing HNH endonuclease family protein [Prevotellaceae bacterium]|jgi:uncharacterized protein with ParB-like and HNH nuclease domain|nr:DUF262 domain-containing HNH endonuclease family protein [Prevotellaceae bacterium]
MKANETRMEDFLSSNRTQFVIPVYQRNYDWNNAQCKRLLEDILEAGSNENQVSHFIGSIVFVHDDTYTTARVRELIIIDGQQRLTSITLIYMAIYWLAKKSNNESLASEILETYLINKFAAEEERLKLRPTENNDKALKYLLRNDAHEEFPDYSKLIVNFDYFEGKILEENYRTVLRGLSKLMFVEISLDRQNDNPQRIFESLNSTGLDLSQADLIRNYILMGLNRTDQNRVYKEYWEIIEQLAKDESSNESKVSDFIRDFLTFINRRIPNKGNVYDEYKEKYPITTVEELERNLSSVKGLAKYYHKLINPQNERDGEIRLHLEYITRLEINVAYPFLMKVYEDYDNGVIDKITFIDILNLIQSFTWRRFIAGLPTSALNKIFMTLYDKIDKADYLYSVQKELILRTGSARFPKNGEVTDALRVKDVYNIKSKNRIYLLERLENFKNTERVIVEGNEDITIEHIFPQNPDNKWKTELSNEEYTFMRDTYLNSIGNLTLSGNNGKLGNKSFSEKRDMENAGYKDSRLWLNKYLASLDCWNKAAIEKRFDLIAERFLKIWAYPNINIETNSDNEEINIIEAGNPTGKRVEYMVFCGEKIEKIWMVEYYVEIFKRLFELQPRKFFTTDLGNRIGLSKLGEESALRRAVPVNDTYFVEAPYLTKDLFNRIKYALTIFELEDELMVKYAQQSGEESMN